MDNLIAMANEVGASVHRVGAHDSVIVFTEEQLNRFANKTATNNEVTVQLWRVLSRLRRSAIDYLTYKSQADNDELVYFIGKAYDVLQENEVRGA